MKTLVCLAQENVVLVSVFHSVLIIWGTCGAAVGWQTGPLLFVLTTVCL